MDRDRAYDEEDEVSIDSEHDKFKMEELLKAIEKVKAYKKS